MSHVTPSRSVALQRGALGILGCLALWEGLTRAFDVPVYVLPAISKILAAIYAQRSLLLGSTLTTAYEAVSGYLLGALIGIGIASLVAIYPKLRKSILPATTALNSVPVIAWSPLILVWFGSGPESKIVMVALAVSFTLFLSAMAGMDRVDARSVDLLRSFGASKLSIYFRLRLPSAMPLIFAGLRVSTARSVLIAVVTEMLGAEKGLGQLIYQAVVQIDFVQVWAAIFLASAMSLAFFGSMSFLERRFIFWK